MRTNEADTNTAYERAVNFKACRRKRGTCCKTAWQTSGATALSWALRGNEQEMAAALRRAGAKD